MCPNVESNPAKVNGQPPIARLGFEGITPKPGAHRPAAQPLSFFDRYRPDFDTRHLNENLTFIHKCLNTRPIRPMPQPSTLVQYLL